MAPVLTITTEQGTVCYLGELKVWESMENVRHQRFELLPIKVKQSMDKFLRNSESLSI